MPSNNVELNGIMFEVNADSLDAAKNLRKLRGALQDLKPALKSGQTGLKPLASGVRALADALSTVSVDDLGKIRTLADGLNRLSAASKSKISPTFGKQIGQIGAALRAIPDNSMATLANLATSLTPLTNLPRANLTSFVNQLQKLDTVVESLDKFGMDKFADQMERLANAIHPLALEMNKVSAGFASFPSKISKVNASAEAYNNSVRNMTHHTDRLGYAMKGIKFSAAAIIIRKVSDIFSTSVVKAAEYQENLNLFSVSMGEYTERAYEYAEQVRDIMGLNPSEWMRNQGVFMTLASGFGVASDKAYLMSKNLTQLGYDIASFFNLSDEVAMQKLRSALSGELEPVRNLGYALSQNNLQEKYGAEMAKTYAEELEKLQETMSDAGLTQLALAHGLKTNVAQMTEAEKAQLRYIALMTQNTIVQGDFARTLEDPANQMRIMREQLQMLTQEFGNVFIPMLTKGLPYVIAFVQGLREITRAMAEVAGFQLPDIQNTYLRDESDALGDVALGFDDATAAAKKYKSYVMGFDELNILDPTEGLGTKKDGLNQFDFDLEQYDYKFLRDAVDENVQRIREQIEPFVTFMVDNMETILTTVGLIGAGLLGWKISTGVSSFITSLVGYKGGSTAIGIGAFIADMGAITMISKKWDELPGHVKDTVYGLERGLSSYKIGIGAALAFSGTNVPLGLALMASGKYSDVTIREAKWDSLSEEAKQAATKTSELEAASLFGVGLVLAFSGVSVPLGIGMMIAGIDEASYAVSMNWEALAEEQQTTIQALALTSSTVMFAAGLVMAFSGANVKLGLGMMATAGVTLFETASWDPAGILTIVTETVQDIIDIINFIPKRINEDLEAIWKALTGKKNLKDLGFGIDYEFSIINPNTPMPFRLPTLDDIITDLGNTNDGSPLRPNTRPMGSMAPSDPMQSMKPLIDEESDMYSYSDDGQYRFKNSTVTKTKGKTVSEADIYTPVYRAVKDAVSGLDLDANVNVYLDGKQLNASIEKVKKDSGYKIITEGGIS